MPKRSGEKEVWSFFSGGMGLDLGLEAAGIQTTLAVEFDPTCCETIRLNRPGLDVWETDANVIDASSLRARRGYSDEVFLMVGGPPCQSFCSGGKRAALSDPRGNLIYTYLKLIDNVRPRYFVLENVANLVTAAIRHRPIDQRPGKHWNLSSYAKKGAITDNSAAPMEADELSGSAIRQVFDDMSGLGYHLNFAVVDAADYGAAQHRLRFIMFGSRDTQAPTIPEATHGERSLDGRGFRSVRDAISDLADNPGPHSVYTPAVAKFFEMIPPGGNWRCLPPDLQREALGEASFAAGGGKTGFFRRLSWDKPSPTVTGRANRKGSALCHPEAIRPLSVKECARLQGFPDDWNFVGAMNRQYLQVGNAVPVPLGTAIGRAILDCEKFAGRQPKQDEFDLEWALQVAVTRLRSAAKNKVSRKKHQPKQPTLF
jgi:DNA (cytosine-5)-methyltransferase 1